MRETAFSPLLPVPTFIHNLQTLSPFRAINRVNNSCPNRAHPKRIKSFQVTSQQVNRNQCVGGLNALLLLTLILHGFICLANGQTGATLNSGNYCLKSSPCKLSPDNQLMTQFGSFARD